MSRSLQNCTPPTRSRESRVQRADWSADPQTDLVWPRSLRNCNTVIALKCAPLLLLPSCHDLLLPTLLELLAMVALRSWRTPTARMPRRGRRWRERYLRPSAGAAGGPHRKRTLRNGRDPVTSLVSTLPPHGTQGRSYDGDEGTAFESQT